jgi:hypothetical protein
MLVRLGFHFETSISLCKARDGCSEAIAKSGPAAQTIAVDSELRQRFSQPALSPSRKIVDRPK